MPIAQSIVVAIRLLVPLSILRWPLAGAIASMAVDALDVVLVDAFARALGEPGEFGPMYAQLDKPLDTYYLTIELYVAWRWPEGLLRGTAAVLYGWRLVGAILFELTAFHHGAVVSVTGKVIKMCGTDTVCIHGDTPGRSRSAVRSGSR